MADLIIKGMEMPKCCALCDLEHWDEDAYGDETNHRCALYYKGYTAKVRETGRLPDCPLSPLPEKHGDLIDRDALLNEGADISDGYDVGGFCEATEWGYSTKMIESAPTIVPAEGGGEDG